MESGVLKDLSLRCNTCKNYIGLTSVLEHKRHHQAMRIMRFKEGKGPRNIDSLSKRHVMLSKKILCKFKDNSSDPSLMRRIEKINEAYETLRFEYTKDDSCIKEMLKQDGKTSMRDGYFEPRDRVTDDDVITENKMSSDFSQFPDCVYGIGHSQATNKEWRDVMEDATMITTRSSNLGSADQIGESCYIGMFDGHHGSNAAQTSAERMHGFIFDAISAFQNDNSTTLNGSGDGLNMEKTTFFSADDDDQNMENLSSMKIISDSAVAKCLSKSFIKMDKYLGYGINEQSRLRWSGCSALTCLITDEEHKDVINEKGDGSTDSKHSFQTNSEKTRMKKLGKMFISNAGNVRAVLYQKRKPFILTGLHNLANEKERQRVENEGGIINSSEQHPRVNGVMETSRGLGNHGDPDIKKCISILPHNSVAKIRSDTQMLVIATNSLWEVLNPNDVFSVLLHSIPSDAVTLLRTGPTPIIPVVHGHYRAGKRGDTSDTHQASTLPSIVETEEEDEIKEVTFVQAQDSDSDDDVIEDEVLKDHSHASMLSSDSSVSTVIDNNNFEIEPAPTEKSLLTTSGEGYQSTEMDSKINLEIREKNARIAPVLSEQLVRAAILAGAVENVSAVVVLFKGMFE